MTGREGPPIIQRVSLLFDYYSMSYAALEAASQRARVVVQSMTKMEVDHATLEARGDGYPPLAKLPDDADIDEIMYRFYVLRRHQPRDKRPTG